MIDIARLIIENGFMKRRIPFLCIAFVFLFLFFPIPSFASDFSFEYEVKYAVAPNGQTKVTQNTTLTNLTSDVYARDYTLTLVSDKITHINAYDTQGAIEPIIKQLNGITTIRVPFNVTAAGEGKQLSFTLEYESGDIAHRTGRIWEILIPGLENTKDVDEYVISLLVPSSFGPAAYSTPPSQKANQWLLSEHKGKGISIAFGDAQRFDFNLKYTLINATQKANMQEITLPPDTAFQKIILRRLSPLPTQVNIDTDGNWLAQYEVKAQQQLDISADGTALIYATPIASPSSLTDAQRSLYTKPLQYWEQSEYVKQLAKKYTTPESIYNYIVDTLSYNYARVVPGISRLGASQVLARPDQAVCMEFSDAFVAIARAAGIPARVNHGFAYTTNSRLQPLSLISDVLHAWPEYFDEKRGVWVPIDPTWADTTRGVDYFNKLDFNHLSFAVLGERSDYPYPAGTFKTVDSGKTVFVDNSSEAVTVPPAQYVLSWYPQAHIRSGGKESRKLRITNSGQTQLFISSVQSKSSQLQISIENTKMQVAPFGHVDISTEISFPAQFSKSSEKLVIEINGKNEELSLEVRPVYEHPFALIAVILLVFGILILYGYTKRKKKS